MFETVKELAQLTMSDPRKAVAVLFRISIGSVQLLELATIVIALGVISNWAYSVAVPGPENPVVDGLLGNPVLLAIIQFMLLMVSVAAIFLIGRMFGGTGSFEQTFLVSIWLQGYMLIIQVVVLFVVVIVPVLSRTLDTGVFVYLMWLLVNFVAALHGFQSRLKVFLGLIFTSVAASFAVLLFLSIIGVGLKGA